VAGISVFPFDPVTSAVEIDGKPTLFASSSGFSGADEGTSMRLIRLAVVQLASSARLYPFGTQVANQKTWGCYLSPGFFNVA
jgi:hypothetical protein